MRTGTTNRKCGEESAREIKSRESLLVFPQEISQEEAYLGGVDQLLGGVDELLLLLLLLKR